MNFWETLVLNIFIVIPPFIYLLFKLKMEIRVSDRYKLEIDKRESFRNILRSHSNLLYRDIADDSDAGQWLRDFSESVINMILWCSDEVLFEYAKYAKERLYSGGEIIDREIHFANSIILFRKELGYKNNGDLIQPNDIIIIFRIGCDKQI
jgi:hypothetical protein